MPHSSRSASQISPSVASARTLMGRDSDDPMSLGEVGHCGVAIDSAADMEVLFKDIPLGDVTTSMTISGPAVPVFCMYLVAAERQVKKPQKAAEPVTLAERAVLALE